MFISNDERNEIWRDIQQLKVNVHYLKENRLSKDDMRTIVRNFAMYGPPEKCEKCDGTGHIKPTPYDLDIRNCYVCRGYGYLWKIEDNEPKIITLP